MIDGCWECEGGGGDGAALRRFTVGNVSGGAAIGTEKGDRSQRDLLTVLVKANQDPDIPESQRMDDDEVIAQVPTFLVAGHETTR